MILKNKYGEIRSGWAIGLLILVDFAIQFIVAMAAVIIISVIAIGESGASGVEYDQRFEEIMALPGVEYATHYFILLLTIGASLLLFRLLYKRPLPQIGLNKTGWLRQLCFGCLFGIVSMSLLLIVLVITNTASITQVNWSTLINPLFICELGLFILVGFSEEISCRGFMMTALKTTRLKWLIILLSSVLFSLMHMSNQNLTVLGLMNLMLAGILFACLFIKTGRLWAPIGFHITWNFFQGDIFGMAVSGGDMQATILKTDFTGPDWVTGGAFGAEGGIVCTLVLIGGLLYIRFLMKRKAPSYWSMDSDMPLVRGMRSQVKIESGLQANMSANVQTSEQQATGEQYQRSTAVSQQAYNHVRVGDNGAKASWICGIIALLSPLLCCFPASLILGIIAVVMGKKAKKYGDTSSKSTKGIIMGIIAIVIGGIFLIWVVVDSVVGGPLTEYFGSLE